ncbi:hypothetical protein CCM_01965 [Cordyceps militaris CM01]|uniref:BTB domain-containing protein n=1 Tax=Cordyceps militaris (strain CM01) TaxID=983644 RepID=G3JBX8_CORMM|nr:uncharacterized protein CCM_01965 [Cordyceps militaris CM01]EGX93696.1 hypothetical protein CCM_01965 [Cordyceps militaris CM01]
MSERYYRQIHESGDLLIVLTPPTEPFALWQDKKESETKTDPGAAKQAAEETDEKSSAKDTKTIQPEYTFLVSSHILRHASRLFEKDLDPDGPWKQPEVQTDGLRHKHLEDFDPQALSHVLNLIHFRTTQVPDKLEMETLAEVAVIVDYFQCHEAMRFAVQSWITEPITITVIRDLKFGRTLMLWLLIASVFKVQTILKRAITILVEEGTGPFDALDLPISQNVISVIDKGREAIINTLLNSIYQFKNDLSDGKLSCSFICDVVHLGALQKQLCSAALYPRPGGTKRVQKDIRLRQFSVLVAIYARGGRI